MFNKKKLRTIFTILNDLEKSNEIAIDSVYLLLKFDMMKKLFFLASLYIFFCACNSGTTKPATQAADTMPHVMIPKANCFAAISDKDSSWLKIEIFPNVATGILKQQIWGKDSNAGTLDGKMEGNTFYGEYTFMSEGVQSIREVAFRLTDSTAIEGIGEQMETGGKMVFKDKTKIDFSNGMVFRRIDCAANYQFFRLN